MTIQLLWLKSSKSLLMVTKEVLTIDISKFASMILRHRLETKKVTHEIDVQVLKRTDATVAA